MRRTFGAESCHRHAINHPIAKVELVLPEEDSRIRLDRDILLMHVADRDSLERLHEAAKQCRKTRAWTRVQAIVLAQQGDTAPDIARALGVSRRAVQTWVAAYNRGGLE